MAKAKIDKEVRRVILDARRMVQDSEKVDCNEAETRRRIERIFETIMGYDALQHLSRERAVRGAGETEYVDFSIQLEEGEEARPVMMIEIKRVNVELAQKHLKQVSSYAINAGCEWIVLTNSKDWKLYHVSFGKPPATKLIYHWNILHDDVASIANRFDCISYKNVKKGSLDDLWQKTNVLHPSSLLQTILSEDSLRLIRKNLRKDSGISLAPEEIVRGVRSMLNEPALKELENIRIVFPAKKVKKKVVRKASVDAGVVENIN